VADVHVLYNPAKAVTVKHNASLVVGQNEGEWGFERMNLIMVLLAQ
jgi:hypothetical protein